MKTIYWFFLGMYEFWDSLTTSPPGKYLVAYDEGREFAHKVTLRKFEQYR